MRLVMFGRLAGLTAASTVLLTAGVAVALSCIDLNAESVELELAEIRIDSEVADTTEFGDELTVTADYDRHVSIRLNDEDGSGSYLSSEETP